MHTMAHIKKKSREKTGIETDFLKRSCTVTPRECAYFPEIISPIEEVFLWHGYLSPEQTDDYLARGWRRSSWYFYRNSCPECRRCLPIRLEMDAFRTSKSQRRILRKNENTKFRLFKPMDFAEKYIRKSLEIHNRFLRVRYKKPPRHMDEYFSEFFLSPVETIVSAMFINGMLAGNGFLDLGKTSISTVYFSFDPHFSEFSPGTFSVLKEIEWARTHGIRYYYLGYLIRELSSMRYKGSFRPFELLNPDTGIWERQ